MKNMFKSAFIALMILVTGSFAGAAVDKAAPVAVPQTAVKEVPANRPSLKEKLVMLKIKSVLKKNAIRQSQMDDATKVVLIILGLLVVTALILVLLIVSIVGGLSLGGFD